MACACRQSMFWWNCPKEPPQVVCCRPAFTLQQGKTKALVFPVLGQVDQATRRLPPEALLPSPLAWQSFLSRPWKCWKPVGTQVG
jgi:hypothetical protein